MSKVPLINAPFDPSGAQINTTIGQINQAAGLNVQGASGLSFTDVSLLDVRNTDGSALAAAASAGKFGASITLGTSMSLIGEAANLNTKTDDCIFEYTLPQSYVAGTNFNVNINIKTTGAGTLTTKTAQLFAFRQAQAGTQGADMGSGTTQNIVSAGSTLVFPVTGTTLNPGDKIVFKLETVLTETGAVNTTANINSIVVGP